MIGAVGNVTTPVATLGAQLDRLFAARWLPAKRARRLCNPADLPPCLERYVRGLANDVIWRAYTDDACLWFAIARAVAPVSKHPAAVALEVHFFQADGLHCGAGAWENDGETGWRLREVIETSYRLR